MKKWGLFIAEPGESVDSGKLIYRSDRGRLQVALKPKPRHLDIFDDLVGGTALSAGPRVDEVLKKVKHGLPYTPEALAYFFVKSKNGDSVSLPAGRYSGGVYYLSGTAGGYVDAVYVGADKDNVYIKHGIQAVGGGPYTSDANLYVFRVKLYIMSNDSHVPSWEKF